MGDPSDPIVGQSPGEPVLLDPLLGDPIVGQEKLVQTHEQTFCLGVGNGIITPA